MGWKRNIPKKELFIRIVAAIWGVGLIAFTLKWISYFEHWYWFPMFPNYWDAWFIITGGLIILLWGFLIEVE